MCKLNKGIFSSIFFLSCYLFSCSDPSLELEKEQAQIKADSIAQGNIDNAIIEKYILDNNLSDTLELSDALELELEKYNIRLIILEEGDSSTKPEVNDIVFVNYTGKFTDNEIFDTSIKSLAMSLDSLAWVKKGVDVAKYKTDKNVDLETALEANLGNDEPLDLPFYSINRSYQEIYYNYTPNGEYVPTGYVKGFYTGLKYLVGQMRQGGKGLVIMPSAVAYGTAGSSPVIPSNAVIMFELDLVEVRQ